MVPAAGVVVEVGDSTEEVPIGALVLGMEEALLTLVMRNLCLEAEEGIMVAAEDIHLDLLPRLTVLLGSIITEAVEEAIRTTTTLHLGTRATLHHHHTGGTGIATWTGEVLPEVVGSVIDWEDSRPSSTVGEVAVAVETGMQLGTGEVGGRGGTVWLGATAAVRGALRVRLLLLRGARLLLVRRRIRARVGRGGVITILIRLLRGMSSFRIEQGFVPSAAPGLLCFGA